MPAPLYAELFEPGWTWRLAIDYESSHWDGDKKASVIERRSGNGTCSVAVAGQFSWGVWSRVDCEGLDVQGTIPPVVGYFAATSSGLYQLDFEPDASVPRDPRTLVLPARPKAGRQVERDPTQPDFSSVTATSRSPDGWCVERISSGGDEGWTSVCLAAGKGFRSGSWGWAGGSTHEAKFRIEVGR